MLLSLFSFIVDFTVTTKWYGVVVPFVMGTATMLWVVAGFLLQGEQSNLFGSLLVSIRTERPEDTSVLATVVLVACLCDGVTNRKASLPSFWTW